MKEIAKIGIMTKNPKLWTKTGRNLAKCLPKNLSKLASAAFPVVMMQVTSVDAERKCSKTAPILSPKHDNLKTS